MTDDQGWGDTGYNGLTKIKTPAIDSMAAGGLRFDRFYAAAPVCSPTRASVLSGRHPFRSGIFRAGDPWRTEELSIAEALKPAGYTTVHFGKWHLNGVGGPGKPVSGDDPLSPGKFGFDEWFSVSNFFDLDCTFGHNGTPVNTTGDGSDVIVAQALKWIEAQSKVGKPFLAVVWFGSPHVPHKPTDADLQTAGGDAYYGEIIGIDRAMGTLRAGLRKLGVAGNTMLWFNSDNGGDTKSSVGVFRGRKRGLYEGGLRVPGILEWPSRIKPAKTSVPVCTSDLYPTILEAAGVSVPNQVLPLDGISLMPLLEGKMAERPRPIGFWFGAERQTGTEPQAGGHAAWSDNRYKLHKISATNFILYDLIDDPSERKDIAKDKPELVTKMKSELDAWQGSVVKSLRGEDYKAGK
jgi:arylsulfatase A-like enzyme